MAAVMDLTAGTVVADRFRLERELGKGGMGAVWLARHVGLDTPCAIKLILAQAAREPDIRARFEREAKAAAHIRSPHVVQILDYGVWNDTPYIAMEYLEGEDLESRLARRGRLDARETATIIGQVARALSKAHALGVVHRDVKPSNIFLVRDDDREVAKVVDFGIAKSHSVSIGEGHTRTGAILGTPFYMSPEQAQGVKTVDHRSDLWSLGVVAFQCMTGRLPFYSEALGDLLVKIIMDPLPVPSRIAPVPSGFDTWWVHAAARDPEQRFQSANELAEALYLALGISGGELSDAWTRADTLPAPEDATKASTPPSSTPGAVLAAAARRARTKRSGAAIAAVAGALVLTVATGALVLLGRSTTPNARGTRPDITAAATPVASGERAPVEPTVAVTAEGALPGPPATADAGQGPAAASARPSRPDAQHRPQRAPPQQAPRFTTPF